MPNVTQNSVPDKPQTFKVITHYGYIPLLVDVDGSRWLHLPPFAEWLGLSLVRDIMPRVDTRPRYWGVKLIGGKQCLPADKANSFMGILRVEHAKGPMVAWLGNHCTQTLRNFTIPEVQTPFLVAEPEPVPCPMVRSFVHEVEAATANAALMAFNFNTSRIRIAVKDGDPWFGAADVCGALDLGNVSQALARLDDDEKGLISNDTHGGIQALLHVSESGLYSLVLGSRKPEAKAFKRWITHEVIPAIRKSGSYGVQQFKVPQTLREALLMAADQQGVIETQQATISTLQPKAAFCDAVGSSTDALTIMAMAKLLETGQRRLFDFLRTSKILMDNNLPYQDYLDRGYFKVIENAIKTNHHGVLLRPQTLVLGKGQVYIERKWNEALMGGVTA